jgi:hypothetical protein
MNSISFNTNFTRLLLLKIAFVVSINTAIAGGGSIKLNRFTEVDFSSAYNNDNGGFYNASLIDPSALMAVKANKVE